MSFSLDYDYALRNRESSLVRCPNFHGVELHLPREIQKVKKDTLPIYSYFHQITGPLLQRYLELRDMKAPNTDILLISADGKPLGAAGCRMHAQGFGNSRLVQQPVWTGVDCLGLLVRFGFGKH